MHGEAILLLFQPIHKHTHIHLMTLNVKIATIIHKSQLSSKILSTINKVVACYSPHQAPPTNASQA